MPDMEYLRSYYPFDDDVMGAVENAHGQTSGRPFDKLLSVFGVETTLTVQTAGAKPIEVLNFTPKEYDETEARVYHLPINNGLQANMIMRGMHLFAADPTKRLVLKANPAGVGSGNGRISLQQAREVADTKTLAPFVDPLLRWMAKGKVSSIEALGYSYGADEAVEAVDRAADYDMTVPRAVFAEPASVVKRSAVGLGLALGSTMSRYGAYIKQSGIDTYIAEREAEGNLAMASAVLGLGRVSNLAIASVLKQDTFRRRVANATSIHGTHYTVAWGTESELALDEAMRNHVAALQTHAEVARSHAKPGQTRIPDIHQLRLQGMHHAGGDDLNLHSAIMLQGLKLAS